MHMIYHETGYHTVTAPRCWNMTKPSAEQDGSTSILKIENLSQSRIISARDFLWQLPKATRLGSSIRGQGCLRLLRNGQRRAIPCKQVLASSLSASASLSLSQLQPFRIHSNSTHIYWNAAIRQNCRSSTAALESATNCFHLLSSESQALKQRVWSENHPPVAPLQWLDESKAL